MNYFEGIEEPWHWRERAEKVIDLYCSNKIDGNEAMKLGIEDFKAAIDMLRWEYGDPLIYEKKLSPTE